MSFTGGGEVVGSAKIEIHGDFGPVEEELKAFSTTAAGAGRQIGNPVAGIEAGAGKAADAVNKKLTPALSSIQSQAAKLAPYLSAAFSVKQFIGFQEASETVKAVFGSSADSIIAASGKMNAAFGLTRTQVLQLSAEMGNALTNLGLPIRSVTTATDALVKRAADVGAAFGRSAPEVAKTFELALQGNLRGLKQLGIDISVFDEKQKAMELGLGANVAALDDAQKAQVIYALVLEKSDRFQGQAAKTADSLAGQMRSLRSEAGDTALRLGSDLAPAVSSVLRLFTALTDVVKVIPAPIRAIAESLTALFVASKVSFISNLVTSIGGISAVSFSAEGALAALAGTLSNPVVLGIVAATGALVAIHDVLGHFDGLLHQAVPDVKQLKVELQSLGEGAAVGKLQSQLGDLGAAVNNVFDRSLGSRIGRNISEALTPFGHLFGIDSTIAHSRKEIEQFAAVFQQMISEGNVAGAQHQMDALRGQFIATGGSAKDFDKAFRDVNDAIFAAPLPQLISQLGAAGAAFDRNTAAINDALTAGLGKLDTDKALTDANRGLTDAETALADLRKKGAVDATKVAAAEQAVADAKDNVAAANQKITDGITAQATAQAALDALLAPATAQQLADATDNVALARIRLNDANRAATAALAALNHQQGTSLNLTGLNLTQLRTALANARASLDATRATASPTGKDPAQLADDVVSAQVAQHQATENLATAQSDLNDAEHKGQVETPAIIAARKTLADAETSVADARAAAARATTVVTEAESKLRTERAGDPGFATQLASAITAVATAHDKVRDAQVTQEIAAAKLRDTTDALAGNIHTEGEKLQEVFDIYKKFGLVVPDVATAVGALIDQIAAQLTIGVDAQGRQVIKPGNNAPAQRGFAEGGLVTNPTVAHIGEFFRPELILPLSNPDRVWELLSQHLPRYMTPTAPAHVDLPASVRRLAAGGSGLPSDQPMTRMQADRIITLLEKIEAKPTGDDVNIDVHPTPGMDEARLARRVARELRPRW